MWTVIDTSAVLDLVERGDQHRNQLVANLRDVARLLKQPEDQPMTLWVPPIALGELALLTYPAYRVSRATRQLDDNELNRRINLAWEATVLFDPLHIGNLRQRLPGLNFRVSASPPSEEVASLAWAGFAAHRRDQRNLHCYNGQIKSIGSTADQLAFELAYALAFKVKSGAAFVSSDADLLASVQQMRTYEHVKLALVDSKNPGRRLQGEGCYVFGSLCPKDESVCQSQRASRTTDCGKWLRTSRIP